jgi:hypothetical protein
MGKAPTFTRSRAGWRRTPLAFFAGLSGVIALLGVSLPAGATAAGTPIYSSSFGPDGTDATFFAGPNAVAVNEATHDVYVLDANLLAETAKLNKFDEDGTPTNFSALGENTIAGFSFSSGHNQIAVNSTSHDIYVVQYPGSVRALQENGEPAEFSALGSSELSGFVGVCGVAVDASGNIYVGDGEGREVRIFTSEGEALTSFSTVREPCNLAVASDGTVYVSGYPFISPGINKFTPSEFPLTASTTYSAAVPVDNAPTFGIAVNPANDELFAVKRLKEEEPQIEGKPAKAAQSRIDRYLEDGTRVGEFAGPGEAGALSASEGIALDGSTGKLYVTDTSFPEGGVNERQVEIFVPPPPNPPSIGASSFSNVTTTSADVQFEVNPESFVTRYRIQYVTQAQFEASGFTGALETPEINLGFTGTTPRPARAHLGGLAPDTAYRFRIVAVNENGTVTSSEPEPGFRTFAVPPAGLPDGRAYEMVSPPQKLGEVIPPDPSRYLGSSCAFECLPGENAQLMPMQSDPDGEAVVFTGQPFSAGLSGAPNEYLSRRSASGWDTRSLSPFETDGSFAGFAADLAQGVIAQTNPVLSPLAPSSEGKGYANLYLWGVDGSLQPLITTAPPNRTSGPTDPNPFIQTRFVVVYAGANSGTPGSPALSHVIFAADDALTAATPDAPPAPEVGASLCKFTGESCNLYEWVDGELRLINVLPNGEAAEAAVFGSGLLTVPFPGNEGPAVDHAISADGRRIFFSDQASGQVYVRIDGKETDEIEDPGEPGKFLTASADGSKVMLDDGCLYDLLAKACVDLSEGQGASKESPAPAKTCRGSTSSTPRC